MILFVLCIKAATGDTDQEMEAAVVTGSSGETDRCSTATVHNMLKGLLYGN